MSARSEPTETWDLDPDFDDIPERIAHLRQHDPGCYLAALARLVRDLDD